MTLQESLREEAEQHGCTVADYDHLPALGILPVVVVFG